MGLRKIISLTSLSTMEMFSRMVYELLIVMLVVNNFGSELLGMIGISSGVLVFLGFLTIMPETVLLRDIEIIKEKLDDYYGTFFIFWVGRSILLIIISTIIAFYFNHTDGLLLALVFIVYSLSQIFKQFQMSLFEFYYINFSQGEIIKYNFVYRILFVFIFVYIVKSNNVYVYLLVYLVSNLLPVIFWSIHIYFKFGYYPKKIDRTILIEIFNSVKSFSIWDHMTKSSLNFIYRIDTFIMYYFISKTTIGYYTLALNIANYMQILPQLFQKALLLAFPREKTNTEKNMLMKSLFISLFISSFQLVIFLLIGKQLIQIAFDTNVDSVYHLSLLLCIAITIFNIFRPIQSFLINKIDMRLIFTRVYLPAVVLSIPLYVLFTYFLGAVGTGIANLVNFTILSILLMRMYIEYRKEINKC